MTMEAFEIKIRNIQENNFKWCDFPFSSMHIRMPRRPHKIFNGVGQNFRFPSLRPLDSVYPLISHFSFYPLMLVFTSRMPVGT